jgi:RNA polymerase II subunit A C-terminal domain phosphatase SSU72
MDHATLLAQRVQVESFGINGHVKLPGPSQYQPNVYEFGTPYKAIYDDLRAKDEALYEHKGLLQASRGPADQLNLPPAGNCSHSSR